LAAGDKTGSVTAPTRIEDTPAAITIPADYPLEDEDGLGAIRGCRNAFVLYAAMAIAMLIAAGLIEAAKMIAAAITGDRP